MNYDVEFAIQDFRIDLFGEFFPVFSVFSPYFRRPFLMAALAASPPAGSPHVPGPLMWQHYAGLLRVHPSDSGGGEAGGPWMPGGRAFREPTQGGRWRQGLWDLLRHIPRGLPFQHGLTVPSDVPSLFGNRQPAKFGR